MLFKYVLVGLLGVGALGAVYVAKTGGCSAPAAADTAPSTTIGAEDCGACPMQGATDVASDALAADGASGAGLETSAAACPMGGSAGVECVEMEDCGEACGDCDEACEKACDTPCETACDTPCETACDTPCDAGPQQPAEKSASE